MTTEPDKTSRKAQIDALLLALPGVSTKKINNLDAYFVSDKMFACISGDGIGLRLPATTATELQFSRDNVVPFQPGGVSSTREWIQINRADAAEYAKDLELFQRCDTVDHAFDTLTANLLSRHFTPATPQEGQAPAIAKTRT